MGIGLDLRGRRKDGTLLPVEVSLGSMDTAKGRLGVAFVSDITERKRLETAVKQDHEQIRALASRLMTVQEEERRRVAREIHDDICQELAALAFDLGELLSEALPQVSRRPIAQEGWRNAFKRSGAKRVAVTLIGDTKNIEITIQDDGVGFNVQTTKSKGGLGLTSMEERIRLVGGSLSITSAVGHGTKIVATAPLSGSLP